MKTGFILVMMFSPMSQYFAGWNVEQRTSMEQCKADAAASIGKPLRDIVAMRIGWEKEMMGAEPVVIAAFCAQGAAAE